MAVERHVADYLDIVFSVARPMSVSTWGLSDRYSWSGCERPAPTFRPSPPALFARLGAAYEA